MSGISALRTLMVALAMALTAGAGAAESLRHCDMGAYERVRDQSIYPLFDALRAGDIDAIRAHLSDGMAAEYQRLFTRNPEYGQFLRDYYADSSFELIDVVDRGEAGHTAVVRIYWADGRSVDADLDLGGALPHLATEVPASCN